MFPAIARRSKLLQNSMVGLTKCYSIVTSTGPISPDQTSTGPASPDQTSIGPASPPTKPVSPHKSCVIRASDYAIRNPLLRQIPTGRLIGVEPLRTLEINEGWRNLLWSGYIHSSICRQKGETITGAFEDGNVGVIKDMDIIGFRNFTRDQEAETSQSHDDYRIFLEKLFGPSSLQELPDWSNFINSLSLLSDDQLLHSPVFFDDDEMASLFFDIHRLSRQELPNILKKMNLTYSDSIVVSGCKMNFLLAHLMGRHGTAKRRAKAGNAPPGSALVDVHRIAVAHAIEGDLLKNVLQSSPSVDQNLLQTYDRREVVRALKYMFPKYPQAALNSFWDEKVWKKLEMDRRHPMPSIYQFRYPAEED